MSTRADIVVVGGGAAGCIAAIRAAQCGAKAVLIEKNAKIGRKLYITGKGRCNVTNDCGVQEVLQNIPRNGRFLNSALRRFPPESVKEFFCQAGVALKTERGNRVFPVSDRAADVIDALLMQLRRWRVEIHHGTVDSIVPGEDGKFLLGGEQVDFSCKAVILATGGISYPLTGSTGDGYRFAEQLGHSVVPPRPSLVPLVSEDRCCGEMQGLSLRNVAVKVKNSGEKVVFEEQGELLFTHFGLSGPLILSASAHMLEQDQYVVWIDLKPALDEQTLEQRLLREFAEHGNQNFRHVLEGLLPRLMVPVMVRRCGIPADQKAHSVTKQQRRRLLETLKGFSIAVEGPRPIEEAIITAGGVKTGEVDPKTMMSKRRPGLFFAGELLDVDAYTGGFNLQIAWATGYSAGEGAAAYVNYSDTGVHGT